VQKCVTPGSVRVLWSTAHVHARRGTGEQRGTYAACAFLSATQTRPPGRHTSAPGGPAVFSSSAGFPTLPVLQWGDLAPERLGKASALWEASREIRGPIGPMGPVKGRMGTEWLPA